MGENRENKKRAFTPTEILNILNGLLSSDLEKKIVRIRGMLRNPDPRRSFEGYIFADFYDPDGGANYLTVKVPEPIFSTLKERVVYELEGTMYRTVRDGGIRPVLVVSGVVGEREITPSSADKVKKAREALERKAKKGYIFVDRLLSDALQKGTAPVIYLVVGESAVTDRDVLMALGHAKELYDVKLIRTNMTVSSLVSLFEKFAGISPPPGAPAILAVVRGGGSGLEVFDDPDVALAAVKVNLPLVTAIGHSTDYTLLDRVADQHFITPTRFGEYLASLAELAVRTREERIRHEREVERIVTERSRAEANKRVALTAAVAFAAGLLVASLLRFF